jgi:hypothetical protein
MRALCRDYCQSNHGFAYWSLAFESKPIFATRSAPLQEERNKESAAELRHIVGGGPQKRGFRGFGPGIRDAFGAGKEGRNRSVHTAESEPDSRAKQRNRSGS